MQYIKGRNIFTLLIVTLTLYTLSLTGPLLKEAWSATGVVGSSVANIRSAPVINNTNIVGTVNKNTRVEIISLSGEWYKVQAGQLSGWMNQSVLSTASSSAPAAPAAPVVTAAEPTPKVILDGQPMQFDVPPLIDNGRTLVPLAAIFRAMGATVNWNAATSTVTATKGDINIVLPIGSVAPTVNSQVWPLDVPAKTLNGRTLAPVRFVGEALGGTVNWDNATYTVTLNSPAQTVGAVTVTAQTVNLRSGPGTNYDIVDTAQSGNSLTVLGAQNGWYQVSRGGSPAWIAGWLVNASRAATGSDPATPAPAVTPTPATTSTPAATTTLAPEGTPAAAATTNPNYITDVSRDTFDSGGEKITISTFAPMTYTSTPAGNSLEIAFSNTLIGTALASYNYNSSLISSMGFSSQTVGGQTSTKLTLNTSKAAKFSVGTNSDNSEMYILFVDRSTLQSRNPIVVLDAGHGGSDPGASGAVLHEKDVTLAVVQRVGKLLTAQGIRVIDTRTDDSYVGLDDRSTIANLFGAAVFVSVHMNAFTDPNSSGTETYCYYPIQNPDLYLQKDERYNLALRLQQSMVAKLGRIDRGVKQANLSVLRESEMPSALVEMAFITNPAEEALLQQSSFLDLGAQAIADGITSYMQSYPANR